MSTKRGRVATSASSFPHRETPRIYGSDVASRVVCLVARRPGLSADALAACRRQAQVRTQISTSPSVPRPDPNPEISGSRHPPTEGCLWLPGMLRDSGLRLARLAFPSSCSNDRVGVQAPPSGRRAHQVSDAIAKADPKQRSLTRWLHGSLSAMRQWASHDAQASESPIPGPSWPLGGIRREPFISVRDSESDQSIRLVCVAQGGNLAIRTFPARSVRGCRFRRESAFPALTWAALGQ